MDATYWGWNFGVVTIKDHLSGRVVWFKFIDRKEKIEDYTEGVRWLENKQVEILGVVSDGLRGLRERLSRYKFQYCQFHQVKTVKHWLTSRPKLEASRELLDIVYFMTKTDKASFVGLFSEWESKWKDFLREAQTERLITSTRHCGAPTTASKGTCSICGPLRNATV